jgi:hypothetical protein
MRYKSSKLLISTGIITLLLTACGSPQPTPTNTLIPTDTTLPTEIPTQSPTSTSSPTSTATPDFVATAAVEATEAVAEDELSFYQGKRHAFTFQLPAYWEPLSDETLPGIHKALFQAQENVGLFVVEKDYVIADSFYSVTLDDVVNMYLQAYAATPEIEVLENETKVNNQGYPYQLLIGDDSVGSSESETPVPQKWFQLIYVHDPGIEFTIAFTVDASKIGDYEDFIYHAFDTFQVPDEVEVQTYEARLAETVDIYFKLLNRGDPYLIAYDLLPNFFNEDATVVLECWMCSGDECKPWDATGEFGHAFTMLVIFNSKGVKPVEYSIDGDTVIGIMRWHHIDDEPSDYPFDLTFYEGRIQNITIVMGSDDEFSCDY